MNKCAVCADGSLLLWQVRIHPNGNVEGIF